MASEPKVPSRWAHRLWDCQQQAAQLATDRDRLLVAMEKAWRQLDAGDAYGKDATDVMLQLQAACKIKEVADRAN